MESSSEQCGTLSPRLRPLWVRWIFPLASSLTHSPPCPGRHEAVSEECITCYLASWILVGVSSARFWQRPAWGQRAREGLPCWAPALALTGAPWPQLLCSGSSSKLQLFQGSKNTFPSFLPLQVRGTNSPHYGWSLCFLNLPGLFNSPIIKVPWPKRSGFCSVLYYAQEYFENCFYIKSNLASLGLFLLL